MPETNFPFLFVFSLSLSHSAFSWTKCPLPAKSYFIHLVSLIRLTVISYLSCCNSYLVDPLLKAPVYFPHSRVIFLKYVWLCHSFVWTFRQLLRSFRIKDKWQTPYYLTSGTYLTLFPDIFLLVNSAHWLPGYSSKQNKLVVPQLRVSCSALSGMLCSQVVSLISGVCSNVPVLDREAACDGPLWSKSSLSMLCHLYHTWFLSLTLSSAGIEKRLFIICSPNENV